MSRLKLAQAGRIKEAPRILIFGGEGVGKTTLAAHAPDPIWGDIEGGSGRLKVLRYPFHDGPQGHVPTSYEDVLAMLDDLATAPHEHKTLVIDTVDRLEALIWKHLLAEDTKYKPKTIEDYGGGYGKGFSAALDKWRQFASRLDRLRHERGMTILLLAHSHIKAFKSPTMDSYDRYTLKMNEKAAGFLKEWCDVVGFACFEDTISNEYDDEKVRGVSTGRRMLKFKRDAAHDGKTRYSLPAEIEMSLQNPWEAFAKALSDAQDMTAEQLITVIQEELVRVGDDIVTAKANKLVEDAGGDVATLQRILEKLRAKEGK